MTDDEKPQQRSENRSSLQQENVTDRPPNIRGKPIGKVTRFLENDR
jgi:hypothetical protein